MYNSEFSILDRFFTPVRSHYVKNFFIFVGFTDNVAQKAELYPETVTEDQLSFTRREYFIKILINDVIFEPKWKDPTTKEYRDLSSRLLLEVRCILLPILPL